MWSSWLIYWHRDSFLVMSYINMSYKVTSPGDLSKRCSHVTHSTQHTNESRTLHNIRTSHVLHVSMIMNESRTLHDRWMSHILLVSLIHELSYPDVPKRTHPFHALQIKYESVTNSTYKRVTNYMQLPQRLHSSHKLHTWISHEIHMYTSHELHAAPSAIHVTNSTQCMDQPRTPHVDDSETSCLLRDL